MAHADWIIDLGPGAGHDGGRIVFQGTPATSSPPAPPSPASTSPPTSAPDVAGAADGSAAPAQVSSSRRAPVGSAGHRCRSGRSSCRERRPPSPARHRADPRLLALHLHHVRDGVARDKVRAGDDEVPWGARPDVALAELVLGADEEVLTVGIRLRFGVDEADVLLVVVVELRVVAEPQLERPQVVGPEDVQPALEHEPLSVGGADGTATQMPSAPVPSRSVQNGASTLLGGEVSGAGPAVQHLLSSAVPPPTTV